MVSSKDLNRWIGRYHLLESYNLVISGPTNSMMAPPLGKDVLNKEILRSGARLPLLRLVVQVLQNLEVAPTQFTPNS